MATALRNYQLYIGGEWVDATSDDGLEVINPATEERIGEVPQGSIADVDRAVAAARTAFVDGTWRKLSPRQRSDALLRFMQAVADRKAELVDLIIAEAGAARWVAEGLQFDTGFKYAQWFAERTASFPFQDPL
ncbi:MAG: aldehyde dehydrogenase family protein, partial [Candidatus Eremiobacteraeota bacterium]|nr:aldehyde dehydrogenase family protein [Candidatus Eremiobacteraeota bacterium]